MAPPNIILIQSDQHRWDCTGYAGNPDIKTPNLDALARHGLNFTNAFCQSPASVPSRATLLTGQYARTHGVYEAPMSVPLTAKTLPRELQKAQYFTGAVGKMHFTPTRANYGFDVMKLAEQIEPGRSEDDYHRWLDEQGVFDQVDHWDQVDRESAPDAYRSSFGAMRSTLPVELYSSTWIGDQAVRFVQSAPEPFFLWVSFIKPHHPFDPPSPWDRMYEPDALTLPEGFQIPPPQGDLPEQNGDCPKRSEARAKTGLSPFCLDKLDEPAFRRILCHYYATISHVDSQIGRLLATFSGRGQTNNVLVYCAGHGGYMGHHGLVFEGGGPPYDALIRVPLLISGFRGQRTGEREPALVQLTDIMPTLLEMAGRPIPDSVDGTSLRSHMLTRKAKSRGAAFTEVDRQTKVVRTHRFKYVQSSDERYRALFDLEKDPLEFDNLFGRPEYQASQKSLEKALEVFG